MQSERGAIDPSGHEGPPAVNVEQELMEMERDLRRRLARTREGADDSPESTKDLTELQYLSSFLRKLLEFIAKAEKESISRVVSVIRSGASCDEILSAVDQFSQGSKGRDCEDEGAASGGSDESANLQ